MFGKKSKQRMQQAEDRLREQALDNIIANPNANISTFAEKPVEVNYNVNDNGKSPNKSLINDCKLMLEVEEISALSRKKYMISPENGILIGSKNGVNNIVIVDPRIDDIQCEILMYQGKPYIRNVGPMWKPILKRGRNSSEVGQGTIPLKSKDRLRLGDVELVFNFVNL